MVYEETINYISETIGWMYFIAWSMSFYPQSWKNYRNKNVGGFSLEFALLNPSGFFFYSVYSVAGRVNSNLGTGTVSSSPCFLAQSFYITLYYLLCRLRIRIWCLLCTHSLYHRSSWRRFLFTTVVSKVRLIAVGLFSSSAPIQLCSPFGALRCSITPYRTELTHCW